MYKLLPSILTVLQNGVAIMVEMMAGVSALMVMTMMVMMNDMVNNSTVVASGVTTIVLV